MADASNMRWDAARFERITDIFVWDEEGKEALVWPVGEDAPVQPTVRIDFTSDGVAHIQLPEDRS